MSVVTTNYVHRVFTRRSSSRTASFRDNPFTVTGSPIDAVTFIGAGLQLVSADDDV